MHNDLHSDSLSHTHTHTHCKVVTHVALCVECVVGELGPVEGDGAVLPVFSGCRGVGVDEDPVRQPRLRTAQHLPAVILETVAGRVGRDDVQQQDVAEGGVQTRHLRSELRKHPP